MCFWTSLELLENPWFEIHDSSTFNDAFCTLYEFRMSRILFNIVIPIFFILEFNHEAMRESTLPLQRIVLARRNIYWGLAQFERKGINYLSPFEAIVSTTGKSSNIWLLSLRVYTLCTQSQHPLADLSGSSVISHGYEICQRRGREQLCLTSLMVATSIVGLNSNRTILWISISVASLAIG